MEKKSNRSVMTPMKKQQQAKKRFFWPLILLGLAGVIGFVVLPRGLSKNASVAQHVETYQLEPSMWEGLIRHRSNDGYTYPLSLVIEEVYSDHSFIGYVKWNTIGLDIVAIEGSVEGNRLTFVETVMLKGYPGNVTRVKRDVTIEANRMKEIDENGEEILTAERRPLDQSAMPEYTAKAMKADFQRWKAEMEVCRRAKQGRQMAACWESLAVQTQVHVFCNEVFDVSRDRYEDCRNKTLGQRGKEQGSSVAAVLAKSIELARAEEPDLEVLLNDAEALLGKVSTVQGEARREMILKVYSVAGSFNRAQKQLQQSDPQRYETYRDRIHKVSEATRSFMNTLNRSENEQLSMDWAAEGQKQREQAAEQQCAIGQGAACAEKGDEYYSKGQWAEAKASYSKACQSKDEKGCLGVALLEAVDGDPAKAAGAKSGLCKTQTPTNLYPCIKLEGVLKALQSNLNLAHAPAPEWLIKEELAVLLSLLESVDDNQHAVGEGMAFFLGLKRPVDFERADQYFLQAASRGADVARWQSEVARTLKGSMQIRSNTSARMWAELKAGLLEKRACSSRQMTDQERQFTCAHLFNVWQ